MEAIQLIEDFIGNGRLERAIVELESYTSANYPNKSKECIAVKSQYYKLQKEKIQGLLTTEQFNVSMNQIRNLTLDLLHGLQEKVQPDFSQSVFISYNHKDRDIALRIAEILEANNIGVSMDCEIMQAGENIEDFIIRNIMANKTTLTIISDYSLISGWVAIETLYTFYLSKFTNEKKMIAAYLTDSFFSPDFRINATIKIDQEIAQIDQYIDQYNLLKIDSTDLNDQKTRWYKLRHNLGEIIAYLKSVLCIDIRPNTIDAGMDRILRSIIN